MILEDKDKRVFTAGKNKGRTFINVLIREPKYCAFILSNCNTKEGSESHDFKKYVLESEMYNEVECLVDCAVKCFKAMSEKKKETSTQTE